MNFITLYPLGEEKRELTFVLPKDVGSHFHSGYFQNVLRSEVKCVKLYVDDVLENVIYPANVDDKCREYWQWCELSTNCYTPFDKLDEYYMGKGFEYGVRLWKLDKRDKEVKIVLVLQPCSLLPYLEDDIDFTAVYSTCISEQDGPERPDSGGRGFGL